MITLTLFFLLLVAGLAVLPLAMLLTALAVAARLAWAGLELLLGLGWWALILVFLLIGFFFKALVLVGLVAAAVALVLVGRRLLYGPRREPMPASSSEERVFYDEYDRLRERLRRTERRTNHFEILIDRRGK